MVLFAKSMSNNKNAKTLKKYIKPQSMRVVLHSCHPINVSNLTKDTNGNTTGKANGDEFDGEFDAKRSRLNLWADDEEESSNER